MKKHTKKFMATTLMTGVLFSGAAISYAHGGHGTEEAYGVDGNIYQEAPKENNYNLIFKNMTPEQKAQYDVAVAATEKYKDFNVAITDGYTPDGPFAEGSQGAMGFHYTKQDINHDTILNPAEPETLLYEPQPDGTMKLVGIEYHVDAHLVKEAPELFGQTFDGLMLNHHLNPNDLTKKDFKNLKNFHYDLHVWTITHNPNGLFAIWNPNVHNKSVELEEHDTIK